MVKRPFGLGCYLLFEGGEDPKVLRVYMSDPSNKEGLGLYYTYLISPVGT